MKANNPHRNRIRSWNWGETTTIYRDPLKAPRWIKCRGLLRDPCDVAGCKRYVGAGEWYVLHPFLGVVCSDCAPTFGAFPPTLLDDGPLSIPCRQPCREHVHLGKLDCPFSTCPMKARS